MKTLLALTLVVTVILSGTLALAFPTTSASGTVHSASAGVPLVFASRNRMETVDGLHVGPPVNIRGREATPGGKLRVLYPDGRIVDLTNGIRPYDVADPDVSYDGQRVVFAGALSPNAPWRIMEINLDGTGLRQLTFDDLPLPTGLVPPEREKAVRQYWRYGDFCPAYLPDGRVILASTRYPTFSASCGERGLNLYVVTIDDASTRSPITNLHRVTTTRAGAYDPSVLSDGRVLLAQWSDNQNTPDPAGPGLRDPIADVNLGPSAWNLWAMNPDGSGAGHYTFAAGPLVDEGGLCQPRELPDGRIVFTVRGAPALLGDTLPSGIAIAAPGMGNAGRPYVLGNPLGLEGPHALCPAPLPDGRIVCAYSPGQSAAFNFGLYVVDDDLQNPTLLYDDPATDELDPVPAVARTVPPVRPDGPHALEISDNPHAPAVPAGTATLVCQNVYADLPLDANPIPSPLVGTVASIEFYDDSPVFTSTIPGLPPRKMPARSIGSVPVQPDGSFTAVVPADKPIFWVLRTATGAAVRAPLSPQQPGRPASTQEFYVPGHDWFRPGQTATCTGCHKGHMIRPDLAFQAQANLARVATASASSTRPGFEFFVGAQRANDLRLTEGRARFAWVAAEGDQSPWVELRWPAPVTVTGVMLYPMAGTHIASAQLTGSDGTVLDLDHWPIDDTPLSVDWPAPVPVEWLRLTFQGRGPVGLAEWAVSGPADVSLPPVPQTAPTNLRPAFPGSSVAWLLWDPVPLAGLAGYRIHYGSAPGVYTAMADVGLVSHHLLTGLANGQTVYAVVRAVSTAEVEGPPSNEVSATIHAPVIESVTPTTGPLAGGTRVTITGRNLAPRGVVVRIGHRSYQVRVVNDHTVEAVTYHAWEPGPVDVEVVNPDGLNAVLPGGFTYQRP